MDTQPYIDIYSYIVHMQPCQRLQNIVPEKRGLDSNGTRQLRCVAPRRRTPRLCTSDNDSKKSTIHLAE